MKLVQNRRKLSNAEKLLGKKVFGSSVPWSRIMITDGLGPIPGFDNPYTDRILVGGFTYDLNMGPDVYPDATKTTTLTGFGRYCDIFVHELTHAWQYDKGYSVVIGSLVANTVGSGYKYKAGKAWDDYNVEQQAQLVEDWFSSGMKSSDDRFVYIDKIIRPGLGQTKIMDLMKVRLPPKALKKLK